MDKVFANFQMNAEFFVLLGLFLLITFLITMIIVVFVTKINTLNMILDQAKEIDEAKIAKIAILEESLEKERTKSIKLTRELNFISNNREKLKMADERIKELEEILSEESNAHVVMLRKLKIDFEQLNVHYELLTNSYARLDEKYQRLKLYNEDLSLS